MCYVLDSSAIIAWLGDEPGADVVDVTIRDIEVTCYVHSINLCEVFYDSIRRDDETIAEAVLADLRSLKVVTRDDLDEAFWKQVGVLKANHRASLADFCAVVLTNRLGATLLTTDHHEFDKLAIAGICRIEFIR